MKRLAIDRRLVLTSKPTGIRRRFQILHWIHRRLQNSYKFSIRQPFRLAEPTDWAIADAMGNSLSNQVTDAASSINTNRRGLRSPPLERTVIWRIVLAHRSGSLFNRSLALWVWQSYVRPMAMGETERITENVSRISMHRMQLTLRTMSDPCSKPATIYLSVRPMGCRCAHRNPLNI